MTDETPTMSDDLTAQTEAILFASDRPVTAGKICQATETSSQAAVRNAIEELNARYEQSGASFRIKAIAGGYQMQTLPEFDEVLGRLFQTRKDARLSQAAIETLAIISYRQPILRADVEAIRGVATGEVLRTLIEKQMVKIVGRADVLGRPMLYGTTKKFLETFGLSSIDDLPNVEELRVAAGPSVKAEEAPAEPETPAEADETAEVEEQPPAPDEQN
jgi:segregation and condensation protein B